LGEEVSLSPSPVSKLYAALPVENGAIAFSIRAENSTRVVIERYLNRYNSPLAPYSELIVSEAASFGIDPKLLIAIAQQESNLGKNSPEGCFNAWGWGIHAKGTKCYENWEQAIKSVATGIAQNYCAKGYCEDPCVMMKKYTPRSNGSWCFGVKQFLREMEYGDF